MLANPGKYWLCLAFILGMSLHTFDLGMNSHSTLHFKMEKLLTNSSKKYEGILLIFKHH